MPDDNVDSESGVELPHGIGRVAKRQLALSGYARYEDLTRATAADLLKIHGVGMKAVAVLAAELAARGLSFREAS
jgi:hypothetical protein